MSVQVTASGIFFATRSKPTLTRTHSGLTQLSIRVKDSSGKSDQDWLFVWTGPQAQAFWDQHGPNWKPGQPLDATVHQIRPHATSPALAPEIHAQVLSLSLAPWRSEAHATTTKPAPEVATA